MDLGQCSDAKYPPKSESLLRARAEREERTGSSEHPAGGAPNPGEDSSSSEPGGHAATAPRFGRLGPSSQLTPGQWKVCTRRSILIAIEAAASSGCGGGLLHPAHCNARRPPHSRK